jgi:hypothetical protein
MEDEEGESSMQSDDDDEGKTFFNRLDMTFNNLKKKAVF